MKLRSLEIFQARVPLKVNFEHASADRSVTETVLIRAIDAAGNIGWGEGCPRHYVTGETIDSCRKFFNRNHSDFIEINSLQSLQQWTSIHEEVIDHNPAAFCAVEMALLDLLCKQQICSIESLLGLPELDRLSQYSGILGTRDTRLFSQLIEQYQRFVVSMTSWQC